MNRGMTRGSRAGARLALYIGSLAAGAGLADKSRRFSRGRAALKALGYLFPSGAQVRGGERILRRAAFMQKLCKLPLSVPCRRNVRIAAPLISGAEKVAVKV